MACSRGKREKKFRSSLPEGLVQATGFQAWKNKRAQKELIPRIKRLALS